VFVDVFIVVFVDVFVVFFDVVFVDVFVVFFSFSKKVFTQLLQIE
jgi:hypothetical protein